VQGKDDARKGRRYIQWSSADENKQRYFARTVYEGLACSDAPCAHRHPFAVLLPERYHRKQGDGKHRLYGGGISKASSLMPA